VDATERLVLFPTWLLLDLLGVVMLSTLGYEQMVFLGPTYLVTNLCSEYFDYVVQVHYQRLMCTYSVTNLYNYYTRL